MKSFACSLAVLAACAVFQAHAQAGDNPPPGLLAKIQIATQAHQSQAAGHEFADLKKFARENPQLDDGNDGVQGKKHGSLDISKLGHDPRTPGAIGKGIGSHAAEGGED